MTSIRQFVHAETPSEKATEELTGHHVVRQELDDPRKKVQH